MPVSLPLSLQGATARDADPRRCDQPWYYWYRYTGAARKFNVLVKGDYAYVRGYWNNELDGRTWAGVRYPTVRLPLESLAVPGSRSYSMPWAQDAWSDWVQQATGTVVDNPYFRPDPKYLDDSIGTIKLWWGYQPAALPTGWRLCDGQYGTFDLRDKFVKALGSDYPGATGGRNTLQTTKMSTLAGNFPVVTDTENQPAYVSLAYIQRTDQRTP